MISYVWISEYIGMVTLNRYNFQFICGYTTAELDVFQSPAKCICVKLSSIITIMQKEIKP